MQAQCCIKADITTLFCKTCAKDGGRLLTIPLFTYALLSIKSEADSTFMLAYIETAHDVARGRTHEPRHECNSYKSSH